MRPSPVSPPEGTYISVTHALRANKGGRTAVVIMRANALAGFGVRSVVVSLGDAPDQREQRDLLVSRGMLSAEVEVLNIYEELRGRDRAGFGRGDGTLTAVPAGLVATDDLRPDGSVHRTAWRRPGDADDAEPAVVDYRRPDGSTFVRWSTHDGTRIELVDHDGRVVRHYPTRGAFVRRWLREIASTGDVFVITDSRKMLPMLMGLNGRRMHLLAAFHNPHMERDGRWDATVREPYRFPLDRLSELDGLVLLTARQRDEIALRCGPADNLFVVPNPVTPPVLPDPLPDRDPKRLVIVARLEAQKRIGHALKAFSLALKHDPELRLEIYGDGAARAGLEKQAKTHGVTDAVTFHGYDPAARDSLLTASALLVTSRHEGYPLAPLEAMSRGCPVISYDIKFGPREQISHGTDGFLVDEGDVKTIARRILDITSDPERLASMSAAAFAKASEHSPRRFADDWARLFATVKSQKATRVQLVGASLRSASLAPDSFRGTLRLRLRPERRPDADQVTASLDVVGEETGKVVSFPVEVQPAKVRRSVLRLAGQLDPDRVALQLGDQPVRARLMVVVANVAWQTPVGAGAVEDRALRLGRASTGSR